MGLRGRAEARNHQINNRLNRIHPNLRENLNLDAFFMPETKPTPFSLNLLLNHPDLFSLPTKEQVSERERRYIGDIPENIIEPGNQILVDQIGNRIPGVNENAQMGHQNITKFKSPYDNQYLYEVVHYLYFIAIGKMLPFYRKPPNRAYIIRLLRLFDSNDLLGLGTPLDVANLLASLQLDRFERDQHQDNYFIPRGIELILPMPNDEGGRRRRRQMIHALATIAKKIRIGKPYKGLHHNRTQATFRSMLQAMAEIRSRATLVDFSLTRIYTRVLNIIKILEELEPHVITGANHREFLPNLYNLTKNVANTILASIPAKQILDVPLISSSDHDILRNVFPQIYEATLKCITMPGTDLVENDGGMSSEIFLTRNFKEPFMAWSRAIGLTPKLALMKRCLENQASAVLVLRAFALTEPQFVAYLIGLENRHSQHTRHVHYNQAAHAELGKLAHGAEYGFVDDAGNPDRDRRKVIPRAFYIYYVNEFPEARR
jgi:hypothetical protein